VDEVHNLPTLEPRTVVLRTTLLKALGVLFSIQGVFVCAPQAVDPSLTRSWASTTAGRSGVTGTALRDHGSSVLQSNPGTCACLACLKIGALH
jgi:hypothetical protein